MEGDVRRWAWGVRGVGVGMTLWGHERQGGRSRGKLAGTRMSGRSVTETSYGSEGRKESRRHGDTQTRQEPNLWGERPRGGDGRTTETRRFCS